MEDFLGHCIEAYAGMPKLLFKWLANDKPRYFFEFLDNSVAKGTYPKLIARGTQGKMQLYQPAAFIDIERYQRINTLATSPELVMPAVETLKVENNLGFIRQCINKIDLIEFVDERSQQTYVSIRAGVFEIRHEKLFEQKLSEPTFNSIITVLAPGLLATL